MASSLNWSPSSLQALAPSIVADRVWLDTKRTYKLHPTSYLDGLRGLAAILVCICHYTEENHHYLIATYGHNHDSTPSSWIQYPFLRIIFSGRPTVHIFFIISGFALSYKPLRYLHAHQRQQCYTTLASSAFRRPFRLFGPCIVSTFLIALLSELGFLYTPAPTLGAQFGQWMNTLFHSVTWPWAWDADLRPGFDVHLWTIPIEFVHSMLLFLCILLLSRLRRLIRQSVSVALMIYSLTCGRWAAFEFLGGMFLADIRLWQQAVPSKAWEGALEPSCTDTRSRPRPRLLRLIRSAFQVALIVLALFIGGWPNFDAEKTPGIRVFLDMTPDPFATMGKLAPQKFWFALSAWFVVWACGDLGPVRCFLENGFSQYCGRISYAVYIIHGPVLHLLQKAVLGNSYLAAVGSPDAPDYEPAVPATGIKGVFGTSGPWQRTSSWFFGLVVLAPLVIWAADLFWRFIDTPIVNLAKRIEHACLDDDSLEPAVNCGSGRAPNGYSSLA